MNRWAIGTVSVLLAVLVAVWYLTPVPTAAARFVWREWHAGTLAVVLDQSDAPLAMQIGNWYFGTVFLGGAAPHYNPALAKRAFTKALAIEPTILSGHYSLARIAFARGDFKTALHEIGAELASNPQNLRSLYIRGLIYGYRDLPGDQALAEADFTRFIAWAPSEWAGYNDLAWILAKEGKYAEVEGVISQAFTKVKGGRENPWFWNELGVARLNLGESAGAKTALTTALTYARKLTIADWREAYSGDSPEDAQSGLDAFLAGISENLAKATP